MGVQDRGADQAADTGEAIIVAGMSGDRLVSDNPVHPGVGPSSQMCMGWYMVSSGNALKTSIKSMNI